MRSAESFIHKLDQAEKIRNGADEQEREMSIGWTIDDQGRHMPIPDWHEKRKKKDPSRGGGTREQKKKSPPCKPSEIEHGCNSDMDCRTDSRTSQATTLQSKMPPAETSYMAGSQHAAAIFHDLDHDSDQLYLTPTNRVLTVEDLAEQQYYKYLSSSKMQQANQKLSDKQVLNEVNRKFFFDGDTSGTSAVDNDSSRASRSMHCFRTCIKLMRRRRNLDDELFEYIMSELGIGQV
ncbi:hypothetical protein GUITHDRAFT_112767 [Guillardia theta CCMP2712]|uniref:Uncharacterized protein n=2 Tax=Guillardia theta TaxID=55529 RepID=L1IYP9_GUITC|nr:hypothetical protein GUITHDRAFT_112767 [Guillardia theta CCMP2712]EKX41029.1 hypothetical protein GUITHDRAFT_112767 [Guillardia theta CCMP2712]|eukprot:XP_005828009.1 hypothetical protein GUITHDRAFT_112767 [Guillardia theta CCMP2712]